MDGQDWENWRATFRSRVRAELRRRGMKYLDLAQQLDYAEASSISYHMTGRGPSREFVEALAKLWPATFASAPAEFIAVKYGKPDNNVASLLRKQEVHNILDRLESTFTASIAAMRELIDAGGGDDESSTAPDQDH